MKKSLGISVVCCILTFSTNLSAQLTEASIRDTTLTRSFTSPQKDSQRMLTSSVIILGGAVASFGILYIMPESVTRWDKSQMSFSQFGADWKEHVQAGPVWDRDKFYLNWIMHPYCGAIYYMTARTAGYSWAQSFAFSSLMSCVFWEFGIEAFAEIPSWQDLFITPILGSMLGEGFHELKQQINSNDDKLFGHRWIGRTTLLLIDPLNEIQDGFKRRKERKSQTSLNSWLGPVTVGTETAYGLNIHVEF